MVLTLEDMLGGNEVLEDLHIKAPIAILNTTTSPIQMPVSLANSLQPLRRTRSYCNH